MSKKKNNYHKNEKKVLDGVDISLENPLEDEEKTDFHNEMPKEGRFLTEEEISESEISFEFNEIEPDKEIDKEKDKDETQNVIQNAISILLTIVVFVALVLIIYVIYTNFIKKDEEFVCKEEDVCKEYINKDYPYNRDDVIEFINNNRGIIYNISNLDTNNLTNEDYANLITYFIWSSDGPYQVCSEADSTLCLETKKTLTYEELRSYFQNYLQIYDFILNMDELDMNNENIRLYTKDDNYILTFNEGEYATYKHNIVNITIDKDYAYITFVLLSDDDGKLTYHGYKELILKYTDDGLIYYNIKTMN